MQLQFGRVECFTTLVLLEISMLYMESENT